MMTNLEQYVYTADFLLHFPDGRKMIVEVKSKRTAKEPDYIRQAQRAVLIEYF